MVVGFPHLHCSICLLGCSPPDTWVPPGGWNGSFPVVYRSFDTLHRVEKMEGTEQSEYGALVAGKVCLATSKIDSILFCRAMAISL